MRLVCRVIQNLLRVAWSPDGGQVSAGSGDRFVYIWDTTSRRILYKLPGHAGSVNEVDFHPFEPISKWRLPVSPYWRVRGKIIRYVLCNIVCNNCAQCDAHTLWTDLTVLWIGFCLTGPISLCLDLFLHVLLYTVCMCRFVTWWGGPDGIEAYP